MPSSQTLIPGLARQPREAFGTVVRRRRNAVKMSQESLADGAAIHVTTLREIEAGRATPTLDTAWMIADSLGVPFSTLTAEMEAETGASSLGDA